MLPCSFLRPVSRALRGELVRATSSTRHSEPLGKRDHVEIGRQAVVVRSRCGAILPPKRLIMGRIQCLFEPP